jgi:hypothetical protein
MSNLIEKQCTLLIPFEASLDEAKESELLVRTSSFAVRHSLNGSTLCFSCPADPALST